jgi:hypothetical protein
MKSYDYRLMLYLARRILICSSRPKGLPYLVVRYVELLYHVGDLFQIRG